MALSCSIYTQKTNTIAKAACDRLPSPGIESMAQPWMMILKLAQLLFMDHDLSITNQEKAHLEDDFA
jgi:hypothetical protein